MVDLGLPPGASFSIAQAISADGTVVAVRANSHAYRWTDAGGMQDLGDLSGGSNSAYAYGISGDGHVIVGHSSSVSGIEAFRWDEVNGMVGLGDIAGGAFSSTAFAASEDGSVIVGRGNYAGTGNQDAFVWDAENGMQDLRQVLIDQGLDLTGWDLWEAQGVSADGRTITGFGTNPSGFTEAWIATIPEPSTGLLLGLGFLGLGTYGGRRSPGRWHSEGARRNTSAQLTDSKAARSSRSRVRPRISIWPIFNHFPRSIRHRGASRRV